MTRNTYILKYARKVSHIIYSVLIFYDVVIATRKQKMTKQYYLYVIMYITVLRYIPYILHMHHSFRWRIHKYRAQLSKDSVHQMTLSLMAVRMSHCNAINSQCQTQTEPVIISPMQYFIDAAINIDDIVGPLNIHHDHGYAKLSSQSCMPSSTDHGSSVNVDCG